MDADTEQPQRDIAKLLREILAEQQTDGRGRFYVGRKLLWDAAREIERLQRFVDGTIAKTVVRAAAQRDIDDAVLVSRLVNATRAYCAASPPFSDTVRAEFRDAQKTLLDRLRAQPSPREVALEKALKLIRLTPGMPFPDPGAHSWPAYANAVHRAWNDIQRIAVAALHARKEDGHEPE